MMRRISLVLLSLAWLAGCGAGLTPSTPLSSTPNITALRNAPAQKSVPTEAVPTVTLARAENGVNVYGTRTSEGPGIVTTVVIKLDREGAASSEDIGAYFLANSILRSTRTPEGRVEADWLERQNVHVSTSLSDEALLFTMHTDEQSDLADRMKLLAHALANPGFSPLSVAMSREFLTEDMGSYFFDPVEHVAARHLLGKAHPLARSMRDIQNAVDHVNVDALRWLHAVYFRPENITVINAGQMHGGASARIGAHVFAGWQPSSPAPTRARQPFAYGERASRKTVVVAGAREDSSLHLYFPAPARNSKDDYAMRILFAGITGIGSEAGLDQVLRHDSGWTYGTMSEIWNAWDERYFHIGVSVSTDDLVPTLDSADERLAAIQREGLGPRSFELAKSKLKASYFDVLADPWGCALVMALNLVHGLDPRDLTTEFEAVDAITLGEVRTVAAKYLDLERAAYVVWTGDIEVAAGHRLSDRNGWDHVHFRR